MRRVLFIALICLIALLPLSAASPDEEALYGFTAATSRAERDLENKFRKIPDAKNLRDYMQRLSARPHHVGSPYDKQNAEWILSQFKSWGLDAQIETFDVLFPTPKERVLELTEPTHFTAKLQEPPVSVDPTSNQQSEQLPTYNAYSIDGDVTGRLVYVNYGLPRDYEELDRLGVSVKGAIVIARYGNSWRGIKPKVRATASTSQYSNFSRMSECKFKCMASMGGEPEYLRSGIWREKGGLNRPPVSRSC
jgi:N-acetylated-alpha-linked acidic dipeptidase